MWMPRAPAHPLETNAESRRVLRAETAPFLADARLDGAQRLAVGVPRDEARVRQVAPDGGEVLLLDAEQVEPLAAGELDGRHLVFLGDLGDRAQLLRRRDAAPDPRHDGVRAVLLDIAVSALVDETRLRVVDVLARPRAEHVEVQRRPALVTAVGRRPFEEPHRVGDRLEPVLGDGGADFLVRVDGALAHALARRRIGVVAAERVGEKLLDEPRARAAARRRFRVRAHVVEREQALGRDRADDVPFANAVAAADLGRVGQAAHGARPRRPGVADVCLTEEDVLAEVRDLRVLAQKLEVPGAVDRVSVEHGALDAVVAHDELLVHAARGVLEHELLRAGPAPKVTGRKQVDPGDLELRRDVGARIAADAELGEMVRDDLGLLEQRRDEPVAFATMLDALAHGIDARIERLHRVVDEHAAPRREPGGFRELDVRPDADGHDDEIGFEHGAVVEPDPAHAALAEDRLGLRRHRELEAASLERFAQQTGRRGVELPFHEAVDEMHDGHVHAALLKPVCRLETEQPAADHDGFRGSAGRVDHALDVVDVAIRDDAVEIDARQRQHDGVRARREQEPVVRRDGVALAADLSPGAIYLDDTLAGDEPDAVLRIPIDGVEHDVVDRLLGREHRREQDTVVVAVRLGAEDRDLVGLGRELDELLDCTHAGHAVADQHELAFSLLSHRALVPSVTTVATSDHRGSGEIRRPPRINCLAPTTSTRATAMPCRRPRAARRRRSSRT